jgi:hypothetical protein
VTALRYPTALAASGEAGHLVGHHSHRHRSPLDRAIHGEIAELPPNVDFHTCGELARAALDNPDTERRRSEPPGLV